MFYFSFLGGSMVGDEIVLPLIFLSLEREIARRKKKGRTFFCSRAALFELSFS